METKVKCGSPNVEAGAARGQYGEPKLKNRWKALATLQLRVEESEPPSSRPSPAGEGGAAHGHGERRNGRKDEKARAARSGRRSSQIGHVKAY